MKKVEQKTRRKSAVDELTAEQFKEFILPFFEEASKEIEAKNKDYNFKLLKVEKLDGPNSNNCQQFKVEYMVAGGRYSIDYDIYDEYHVANGTMVNFHIYHNEPQLKDPSLKKCLEKCLDNLALDYPLMEYLYKIHGDEYKDWVTKNITKSAKEEKEELKISIKKSEEEIKSLQAKLSKVDRQSIIDNIPKDLWEEIRKLSGGVKGWEEYLIEERTKSVQRNNKELKDSIKKKKEGIKNLKEDLKFLKHILDEKLQTIESLTNPHQV